MLTYIPGPDSCLTVSLLFGSVSLLSEWDLTNCLYFGSDFGTGFLKLQATMYTLITYMYSACTWYQYPIENNLQAKL